MNYGPRYGQDVAKKREGWRVEGDREGSATGTETLIPCYIGRLTEQRFLPFRERLLDFGFAWRSEINRGSRFRFPLLSSFLS